MALRNLDDNWLGRSLCIEVSSQLVPQEPCLTPDDAVFARIETRMSSENLYPDLLFRRILRVFTKSARRDIQQKIPQTRRPHKVGALYNPLYQLPPYVPFEFSRFQM